MKKKDLLKKIRALAKIGVGGEQENARIMLDKLMAKYGITEAELSDDYKQDFYFKYGSNFDEKILIQIIYKVENSDFNLYSLSKAGHKIREVITSCTTAQKIEIEFLYNFYSRLFKQEQKVLLNAFIQKHELFGTFIFEQSKNNQEVNPRMLTMMKALSDEKPLKQIKE